MLRVAGSLVFAPDVAAPTSSGLEVASPLTCSTQISTLLDMPLLTTVFICTDIVLLVLIPVLPVYVR